MLVAASFVEQKLSIHHHGSLYSMISAPTFSTEVKCYNSLTTTVLSSHHRTITTTSSSSNEEVGGLLLFEIIQMKEELALEKAELNQLCHEKNKIRRDNFQLQHELRLIKRDSLHQQVDNMTKVYQEIDKIITICKCWREAIDILSFETERMDVINSNLKREMAKLGRNNEGINSFSHQLQRWKNHRVISSKLFRRRQEFPEISLPSILEDDQNGFDTNYS